jgi:hypothetical protein
MALDVTSKPTLCGVTGVWNETSLPMALPVILMVIDGGPGFDDYLMVAKMLQRNPGYREMGSLSNFGACWMTGGIGRYMIAVFGPTSVYRWTKFTRRTDR